MKRNRFLAALAALPFAPGIIAKAEYESPVRGYNCRLYHPTISNMIEHWSGGIRPLSARVDRLAETGDAVKYQVVAQHPDGKWYRKNVLVSDLYELLGYDHWSTWEYCVSKAIRELSRDWAFLKRGDDWRSHVPPFHRRWHV